MISPLRTITPLTPPWGGDRSIIRDSFTDVNGTLLNAHTPERVYSGGWSHLIGTMEINSNQVREKTLTAGVALSQIETGQASLKITCPMTPEGTGASLRDNPGIAYRINTSTSYFFVQLNWTTQLIELREINPANTLRASAAITLVAGTEYTMVLTLNGNLHTATVGAVTASYTSAVNNTVTKHGIRFGAVAGGTLAKINSFVAEPL